jgi:hypothetical protein
MGGNENETRMVIEILLGLSLLMKKKCPFLDGY